MKHTLSYILLGLGLSGLLNACTPQAKILASGFHKTLALNGISFDVSAANNSSLGTVIIKPLELKKDNKVSKHEVDGTVVDVKAVDLNADGSPELYDYTTSAGSGSYGSIIAYSVNNNKSLSRIYLPDLSEDKKNNTGYMGHDSFKIVGNRLTRTFPVYRKEDANLLSKRWEAYT